MASAPTIACRRRTLPQPCAKVDWSHPLSLGLVAFVAPAWVYDFTRLTRVAITGSVPLFPTEVGHGRRTWDQSNRINLGSTGTPILGNLAVFTMTAVVRVTNINPGGSGGSFFCERGSAGNPINRFAYGASTTGGKLDFAYRDNAGTLFQLAGNTTFHTSGTVVVAIRRTSATAFDGWLNGANDTSGTSGSMTATFSEATLENRIGSDIADSTASLGSGCVAALILHTRALSQSEMVAMAMDPFQMLRL